MTAKPTNAIAYVRSATPTASHTADRINIETQRITAYCNLNRITLVDMVVDEAGGGRLDARPSLQVALSALADGRADVLIVPSLATLSRSVAELGPWLAQHFGPSSLHGLIVVQEQIDTRQATGRLALGVLSGLSLFDRGERHA